MNTHKPSPDWLVDGKFGIFFHWGAFSVPAYGTEWYPRTMYLNGTGENAHHVATYGTTATWPYHNFIDGAKDKAGQWTQFAPKLRSAGGAFDPDGWARLFDSAGAKFVGQVAEHHDGFSMWNSSVNEWNSVRKGPKLDLARLFADAFRARGLKFAMTMHHVYHFTGYFEGVPLQADTSLQKLYGQLSTTRENQLWFDKLKEIVDKYQPDLIYHDGYLDRVEEAQRLKFLAYYYNRAQEWNKEVAVTYKDGMNPKAGVLDFERGGPTDLTYPYWMTDDCMVSYTWGYVEGMWYYSPRLLLHRLVDVTSKNGSLFLNILPKADGTIPAAQRDILLDLGDWLRRYGEAIYGTRAWVVSGEGPTKMGGGAFVDPKEGTAKDWRFTRTKDSSTVYAIALGWPGNDSIVTVSSVTKERFVPGSVSLLAHSAGSAVPVPFTQDDKGLHLRLSSKVPYPASAYVFRLSKATSQPSRTVSAMPRLEAEEFSLQSGIQLGKQQDVDAGLSVGWIENGDWAGYLGMDFGAGLDQLQARVASATAGGGIEIRLDSLNGTLAGTCAVPGTGGWEQWTTVQCKVARIAGVHDLYVRFVGGGSYLLNLNWLQFSSGTTGIQVRRKMPEPHAKGALGSLPFDLIRVDGKAVRR